MINITEFEDGLFEIKMEKDFENTSFLLIQGSSIVDWVNLSLETASSMLKEFRKNTGIEPNILPSSFWRSSE